jgi:hypothetical protein
MDNLCQAGDAGLSDAGPVVVGEDLACGAGLAGVALLLCAELRDGLRGDFRGAGGVEGAALGDGLDAGRWLRGRRHVGILAPVTRTLSSPNAKPALARWARAGVVWEEDDRCLRSFENELRSFVKCLRNGSALHIITFIKYRCTTSYLPRY